MWCWLHYCHFFIKIRNLSSSVIHMPAFNFLYSIFIHSISSVFFTVYSFSPFNLFLFPLASALLFLFSSYHHHLIFFWDLQSVQNIESFTDSFRNSCHSQLPLKNHSWTLVKQRKAKAFPAKLAFRWTPMGRKSCLFIISTRTLFTESKRVKNSFQCIWTHQDAYHSASYVYFGRGCGIELRWAPFCCFESKLKLKADQKETQQR